MTRAAQFELAFEGEPRPPIARLRPVVTPVALPASSDWADAREGVREVMLTLLATLAIGLSWAAIEAGRANAELVRAGAAGSQTRYAGAARAGR